MCLVVICSLLTDEMVEGSCGRNLVKRGRFRCCFPSSRIKSCGFKRAPTTRTLTDLEIINQSIYLSIYKVDRCLARYSPRAEANNGTMRYHAIRCNTVRFYTIQCDTVQYNAISCNTMQYNEIPCNTIRYNSIP